MKRIKDDGALNSATHQPRPVLGDGAKLLSPGRQSWVTRSRVFFIMFRVGDNPVIHSVKITPIDVALTFD